MTLLRRLLGQTPQLPAEIEEARADLQRLAQEQPSLAAHALTLADVLPALFSDEEPEASWSLPPERATAKWDSGVPLLRGETLPLDITAFNKRWQRLAEVLGRRGDKQATGRLRQALERAELQPQEMAGWVLGGQVDSLHARADALGLDAVLAATLLRWSLFPALTRLQARLAASLPATRWPHGYCPICGGWPLLGEFRGLEQVRFLRCGLCAWAWEFPRLRCPFCSSDDHRRLGYLHRDGQEGQERVATCDACRGYVKMVATLTPLAPVRLLVMEAVTLPLDLVASERGYVMP